MQNRTQTGADGMTRLWGLLIAVVLLCAAASVAIGILGAKRNATVAQTVSAETEATAFPEDYQRSPNGISYANLDLDAYIQLGAYKGLTAVLTVGSTVTDADVRAAVNAALAAHTTGDTSPAYDDNFAKLLGYPDKATYEAALREELIAARPAKMQAEKETAALCAAVQNATVLAYPENAVEDQMYTVLSQIRTLAKQNKMSYETLVKQATGLSVADYESDIRSQAEYSVKRELVLAAIAKAEGIPFSDKDAESYLSGYTAILQFLVNNTEFVGVK